VEDKLCSVLGGTMLVLGKEDDAKLVQQDDLSKRKLSYEEMIIPFFTFIFQMMNQQINIYPFLVSKIE
jgi:hypothetical protein